MPSGRLVEMDSYAGMHVKITRMVLNGRKLMLNERADILKECVDYI